MKLVRATRKLSTKMSGTTRVLRGIKQGKPFQTNFKLNPYKVSRGRGIQ